MQLSPGIPDIASAGKQHSHVSEDVLLRLYIEVVAELALESLLALASLEVLAHYGLGVHACTGQGNRF